MFELCKLFGMFCQKSINLDDLDQASFFPLLSKSTKKIINFAEKYIICPKL